MYGITVMRFVQDVLLSARNAGTNDNKQMIYLLSASDPIVTQAFTNIKPLLARLK